MEAILSKLKAKAELVQDNTLLRDTISLLTDLHHNPALAQHITWEGLMRDFERLRDHGLWDISEENVNLLHALRSFLTTKPFNELDEPASDTPAPPSVVSRESQQTFSIVVPPPESAPSPLIPTSDPVLLPIELVDILNHTYFLHLLATDPQQVLPPGKSLISIMSRSRKKEEDVSKPTLHDKVEDLVHKAFWDEVIDSLSNPEPSSQLPRIKLLYHDLHIVLTPLFPPRHPIITTLSSPLSPTSSPLDSAIMHLREVVTSLRERCAPVRDQELDNLLHTLDNPPLRSSRPIALATLVADTVKSILRISEVMKDDLSQFVLGSMTEQQLRSVVSKQAKTRERHIILDIWKPEWIESSWQTWLESYSPSFQVSGVATELRFKWIVRLVQALGSSTPVSCKFPTKTMSTTSPEPRVAESPDSSPPSIDNPLPPVFFFSVPALLEIQNYLQALVISASLRSLTRPAPKGTKASDAMSFVERIWILLKGEIIEEPGSGDTKLVHLADEVVRARQLDGSILSTEEETRLRAAVERTLNPSDPVFVLLQKRVLKALVDALAHQRSESRQNGTHAIPQRMQTGLHGERAGKKPRLVLDPEDLDTTDRAETRQLTIEKLLGFEDECLRKVVEEVFVKVDACVIWLEDVWQDVLRVGVIDDELVL
ncbi:hypothetical protein K503DRAFT_739133 [Rhizopogon vinicolor AM-OR11-026]|uniref:Uncharacterized protein n=1 Tax=Rhizopogon vinicolor AM-OR11-026 TaxID=1314800 RepID=A0A1B7N3Z6_9AGAM|nr:hypothetical protein K503DRAFT_739133 [Rhizopogon vinicolor AM-OR11-026]